MILYLPSLTDLLNLMDTMDTFITNASPLIGYGVSGETNTIAIDAQNIASTVEGLLPTNAQTIAKQLLQISAPSIVRPFVSTILNGIETTIRANLPSTWQFTSAVHTLDGWLSRLNASRSGTPVAAAAAPVIAGVSLPGGQLTQGIAYTVVITYVGADDSFESVTSPSSNSITLGGTQNSLVITTTQSGVIPTGVTKIRCYINIGGNYMWVSDTPVTGGTSTYPSITINNQISSFVPQLIPPSYCQALLRPGAASLFAIAFAMISNSNQYPSIPQFNPSGMLSSTNVGLSPSGGSGVTYPGIGNSYDPTPIQFGTMVLGSTYAGGGSLNLVNIPSSGIIGAYGALGLRMRSTVELNGTRIPTIQYTYYDAASPSTPLTATITAAIGFAGSIVNETVGFSIPAGQIVLSVIEQGATGTATTGTYVYEPLPIR